MQQGINQTYKDNLLKLQNLVLVLFEDETIVQPKESEWFGFYAPGQDKKIVSLFDSPIYKQVRKDRLTFPDEYSILWVS